jgi:hypothetical protein
MTGVLDVKTFGRSSPFEYWFPDPISHFPDPISYSDPIS